MSLQVVQEVHDWIYKHLTLTDNEGLALILTKVPKWIRPPIQDRPNWG